MQVWINGEDEKTVAAIAKTLSKAVDEKKDAQLKSFLIVLTDSEKKEETAKFLEKMAEAEKLENIGVAYLAKDDKAVSNYKVNTDAAVKTTIFVYKKKRVVAKFVNLKADEAGLAELAKAVESAVAAQ